MSHRRNRTAVRLTVVAAAAAAAAAVPSVARAAPAYTFSGLGIPDTTAVNGGGSAAFGISPGGLVAGQVTGPNGYGQAFVYNTGNGTLRQLPNNGGRGGLAYDVNDHGVASGYSRVTGATPTAASAYNADVWQNGPATNLGTGNFAAGAMSYSWRIKPPTCCPATSRPPPATATKRSPTTPAPGR